MKASKETIIRTVVMALALANSLLAINGKNPLPWADEEIYNALSGIAVVASTLWAWWKNNSFTPAAIRADEILAKLKGEDENE